jgi:diguanylate cyclase (GGDEF) domain
MDLSGWSRSLYKYLWLCLLVILLTEFSVFLVKNFITGFASGDTAPHYLLVYLFLPTMINITILVIATLLTEYFIRKRSLQMQAFTIIMASLCVCSNVVYVHYVVSSVYFVFFVPIIMSLFYIDFKPLLFSTIASLACYLSFVFFILPYRIEPKLAGQGSIEIIANIALIIILFLLVTIVLRNMTDLSDRIIAKNIQARQDSLTKLLNHRCFYDQLDGYIATNRDKRENFSLILWDIDGFKQVNDRFGHLAGDRILLCFVHAMTSCLNDDEPAFRYGGEEFTILTVKNAADSDRLVQKIKDVFDKQCRKLDLPVKVTACAGICMYDPKLFFGRHELFAAADKALYKAKQIPGKDAHFIWRPDLDY